MARDVLLRPLAAEDQPVIERWASGMAEHMSRMRPYDEAADRHDPEAGLFWYMISEAGRDVGAVWIELSPGASEAVLGIFLGDPSYFGRGIGRAAIGFAVAEFRDAHPDVPIVLRVRRSNARAIACYGHAGFAVTGTGTKTLPSGEIISYYRMVLGQSDEHLEIGIRNAAPEDAEEIASIHEAAVLAVARDGGYSDEQLDAWAHIRDLSRLRAQIGERTFFVGAYAARLVGYAQLDPFAAQPDPAAAQLDPSAAQLDPFADVQAEPAPALLRSLYVLPEYWRRGVGRRLTEALLQTAREAGHARLELDASINAVPFYEALGFARLGAAEHVFPNGVSMSCVRMERALKSSVARPFSTIVFDLDGTLTDPSLGIVRCVEHALRVHGLPVVPAEQIVAQIGPPLDDAFGSLVPGVSPSLVDALVTTYRERYATTGLRENVVYPGIPQTIEHLASQGRRLGVCTSKRRDFAEKILALFGLLQHFAFVDGGDIGVSKRDQLARLLDEGVIDADAVVVGDRDVDVEAARANGLRSVAVSWGFAGAGELVRAGPTCTAATVAELLKAVGA